MSDDEYAAAFQEEAAEILEELESTLLDLEKNPDDMDIVGNVFRSMHTIKGSSAMFGFDTIADFTHHVETVLGMVRDETIKVTTELIDLVLASKDHIRHLLAVAGGDEEENRTEEERILTGLQQFKRPEEQSPTEPEEPPPPEKETGQSPAPPGVPPDTEQTEPAQYHIHLAPAPSFFENNSDIEPLLEELEKLGSIRITSPDEYGEADGQPQPETTPFWDILLTSTADLNTIRDIFIFVENDCTITITPMEDDPYDDEETPRPLGEILVTRGDISNDLLDEVLAEQKPLGEMLVERKAAVPAKVQSALAEQQLLREKKNKKLNKQQAESIRVNADKLDSQVNLVGELVVVQSRLAQLAKQSGSVDMRKAMKTLERLTAEIRDNVLDIRMLPIGTIFSKFKRLVRDLSSELGKDIEMITQGAETELDKSVLDQLGEPLVHMIRNSIDHGIENPEERLGAGKPAQGTVTLSAAHSGANVVITVTDDGRGLDVEKIRAKVLASGLITADQKLSDQEIFGLIFGAGVSTAEKVTSVSGRGVGMDVVKTTIEGKLNGKVEVDSVQGQGTTVTIQLPLTLAIIDGLLIRVGSTHFVLPLVQVEKCAEISAKDIEAFHDRRVFPFHDHLVPYVRLRDIFEMPGERPPLEHMAIIVLNGEQYGIVADQVIGGHQTVIKSLGWVFRKARGVSGATILGNGEVSLIVDVPELMRMADELESS